MFPFIEDIPFPVLITDGNGLILKHNQMASTLDIINFQTGKNILTDMFDRVDGEGEIRSGYYKKNHYLILSKELHHNHYFYVIIEDSNYYKLLDQKTNRELQAIIDRSYDGIYITDAQGNTLMTNAAIERITGIPKHYYIGKNTSYLMERGILQESPSNKVLETKETVTLVHKNPNQKETLLTSSPVFNEKGEIEKVITNIRDLTELNKLNRKLNKVQKLNEKYKIEIERLKAHKNRDPEVVLKSKRMHELFDIAERLASVDTTVLILGETGVGKDVFARHLYSVSNRYDEGDFIKVNCGAIPKDLIESELFGYESGAFSGASKNGKPGVFELADKGILFLDEVGELPLSLQVKLLRVLQEKEIQRVGGTKNKKVDVRVIAATNQDLRKMVNEGTFREDLYYRLNVVPISIPPLRERKDDILPLVQNFLKKCNEKYDMHKSLSSELKEFFYHYDWPGNVRELANLVERMVLTVSRDELVIEDLPEEYKEQTFNEHVEKTTLKEAVEEAERNIFSKAVEKCDTTYQIAKELETSQATVVRKLKKYKLNEKLQNRSAAL